MALVSLAEAAKLAGVSRQTVYRKVNGGELSATRRPDGSKGVDTSELERVFGGLKSPVTSETVTATVTSDNVRQGATEALQAELEAVRAQLALQNERVVELQMDKARLWDQVEHQRLLLEAPARLNTPAKVAVSPDTVGTTVMFLAAAALVALVVTIVAG
jgi:excisionase family DNA binding protein